MYNCRLFAKNRQVVEYCLFTLLNVLVVSRIDDRPDDSLLCIEIDIYIPDAIS